LRHTGSAQIQIAGSVTAPITAPPTAPAAAPKRDCDRRRHRAPPAAPASAPLYRTVTGLVPQPAPASRRKPKITVVRMFFSLYQNDNR